MAENETNLFAPDYAVPPGETVLEILQTTGLTQRELAKRSGRPVKTINEIIRGKASITPQTALQFEKILGVPASFWNKLESNYQASLAQIAERQELEQKIDWLGEFPIREMVKRGWIKSFQDKVEQLRELLRYFGVASINEWGEIWSEEQQAALRESRVFQSHKGALSAWLRQGKIQAQKTECVPYNKKRFRDILNSVRGLTLKDPQAFVPELTKEATNSGVVVLFIQELPGMRISGATQWVSSNKVCIQLTLRYKTNDQLWFTFFHEAGHVLYDNKRMWIDEKKAETNESEKRADRFACNTLLPSADYKTFLKQAVFSPVAIRAFAEQIGIAPGIVVGRLQHEKRIPWNSPLNRLKEHYKWV